MIDTVKCFANLRSPQLTKRRHFVYENPVMIGQANSCSLQVTSQVPQTGCICVVLIFGNFNPISCRGVEELSKMLPDFNSYDFCDFFTSKT